MHTKPKNTGGRLGDYQFTLVPTVKEDWWNEFLLRRTNIVTDWMGLETNTLWCEEHATIWLDPLSSSVMLLNKVGRPIFNNEEDKTWFYQRCLPNNKEGEAKARDFFEKDDIICVSGGVGVFFNEYIMQTRGNEIDDYAKDKSALIPSWDVRKKIGKIRGEEFESFPAVIFAMLKTLRHSFLLCLCLFVVKNATKNTKNERLISKKKNHRKWKAYDEVVEKTVRDFIDKILSTETEEEKEEGKESTEKKKDLMDIDEEDNEKEKSLSSECNLCAFAKAIISRELRFSSTLIHLFNEVSLVGTYKSSPVKGANPKFSFQHKETL